MLEEPRYLLLVDATFKKILDAFDDLDPDDAEAYFAADVITITFRDQSKCVVNTQRPTRQIWLAARARAWHFAWDEASAKWLDDRGRGEELLATLRAVVKDSAGLDLAL